MTFGLGRQFYLVLCLLAVEGLCAVSTHAGICKDLFLELSAVAAPAEMTVRQQQLIQSLIKLNYSPESATNFASMRPDIAEAILAVKKSGRRAAGKVKSVPLPNGYTREKLPYFFKDKLWEPAVFYRGVNEESINPLMEGERYLIWGSPKLSDATLYAINSYRARRVLVLRYEVPRFMVYVGNSWPVVRFEDAPDLRNILTSVAEIRMKNEAVQAVSVNESTIGDGKAYAEVVNQEWPGFLEGRGSAWKKGREMEPYFLNKTE